MTTEEEERAAALRRICERYGSLGSISAELDASYARRRALIEWTIKMVADEAWSIAAHGHAPDAVCLAIEALSDDPATKDKLLRWALAGKRDEEPEDQ